LTPRPPELDETLLSQVRLGIVSVLATQGPTSFTDLKTLLRATQGNLGAHLRRLEDAGYVAVHKAFAGRTPHTTVLLTPAGRAALTLHVERLIEVLRLSKLRTDGPRRRPRAAAEKCRT
jgi:DNA-binding MarR family transcriptional regulator